MRLISVNNWLTEEDIGEPLLRTYSPGKLCTMETIEYIAHIEEGSINEI